MKRVDIEAFFARLSATTGARFADRGSAVLRHWIGVVRGVVRR
jgi:hypothetical protein